MDTIYYAKSEDETGNKVTNRGHLQAVSELAEKFGKEINMPNCAMLAGILHDFGKYSRLFQDVLRGTASNIDHAICAAAFLAGTGPAKSEKYQRVASVIAAHHSVLRAFKLIEPEIKDVFHGRGSRTCSTGRQAALFGRAEFYEAEKAFSRDFPGFHSPKLEKFNDASLDEKMLRTRMLFSCLVDADYTVSSGTPLATEHLLEPEKLLNKLYAYMQTLRAASVSDTSLNAIRDEIFRQCGNVGDTAPGLFTLTAPTGVGKTLALLHFALRHCVANSMRRIILVLPFLTLTEQSELEYKKIIPHILSDHSQSRMSEEQRELAHSWNAPFIITTSVRFFESLFSSRPGDCRKLHNIAQSVIIFDEAQSLPMDLASATMRSVTTLCKNYGCSMVLSTATQPDFSALPDLGEWHPTEIIPDGKKYYGALRRTIVRWRLKCPTALEDIAREMSAQESVCAIVSLRRHAVKLYEMLQNEIPETEADSIFFLTTDLCPEHRSAVISAVRDRLSAHLPCRVVSTQCIESGVDLDFASMYRALAPLEAVIQAAGRCNRNGNNPDSGLVTVFIPEDKREIYPSNSYRYAAHIVKLMCSGGELDIHDPAVIAEYYRRLFSDAKDKLAGAIAREDYSAVNQEYELIGKHGVQVVVPYNQSLFEEIRIEAQNTGVTPALIKKAAPITVSSFHEELVRKYCEQIPGRRRRHSEPVESDFYILSTGHENYYRPDMGLQLESPSLDSEIYML